jgi:cell division protein FtsI (penicillin-binding protein 3)
MIDCAFPVPRTRAAVFGALFLALFLALLARLYALQILDHEDRSAERRRQSTGTVAVDPAPGSIVDARGQMLAVSVPVDSVWADPSVLPPADRPEAARLLARALSLRPADVFEDLSRPRLRFVWIKRKVTPEEAGAVRRLMKEAPFRSPRGSPEPRLGLALEYARKYPFERSGSHVVGFRSEDPAQHEGVHRTLAPWLEAARRTLPVSVDALRRPLDAPPADLSGARAALTVDMLLQQIVEEELEAASAEFRPRWAVAVVLDPMTGAVLAMANRPDFDPSRPAASPGDARRNRAVVDPYEPGSTLKPFVVACALDLGLASPETRYDCENGLWKHGPRLLHDHHPYGTITLAEIVVHSSNIGAAKVGALTLGRARLYEAMRRWGFGSPTGVGLPAEDDGRLYPPARWSLYSDTSVPMGHEIAVTPLQLACAMSAIANGGTLYRPFVVRRVTSGDGTVLAENGPQAVRRVIGEKAAREMNEILKRVVSEGTGRKAQVEGVRVAGKTGTTQKVDPQTRRYTHERFISSFVGYAPADEPRMCVAVILDEPQGAYYGGTVAAPVVGRIVRRGLELTRP